MAKAIADDEQDLWVIFADKYLLVDQGILTSSNFELRVSNGEEKCQELLRTVKEFVKSMEKCLQPGSKVRISGVIEVDYINLTLLSTYNLYKVFLIEIFTMVGNHYQM